MGGFGLQNALGPVASAANKQAKAGKLKSLKVKMKFDPKADKGKPAKDNA